MVPHLRYTVPAHQDGVKLDRLVVQFAGVSRRVARLLIASGQVWVNKRAVRIVSRPIAAGTNLALARDGLKSVSRDRVSCPGEPWPAAGPQHKTARVRILYMDRYVVALDKPAGLLSETDRFGSPSLQTVVPQLLRALGEHNTRLWLVHRLDAGTSGVILMARTPSAVANLSASFRDGAVQKDYLALCQGQLAIPREVEAPIGRLRGTQHAVMPQGRPAKTAFVPLCSASGASSVLAKPSTGRTHQIRVHLAHLGHPILGDRLYGGPGYAPAPSGAAHVVPIARALLHAWRLSVAHPMQATTLRLHAPIPEDMPDVARCFGMRWLINEWL